MVKKHYSKVSSILLLAAVVATVVVWGFGIMYENVSVYDPYWSAASLTTSPAMPTTRNALEYSFNSYNIV